MGFAEGLHVEPHCWVRGHLMWFGEGGYLFCVSCPRVLFLDYNERIGSWEYLELNLTRRFHFQLTTSHPQTPKQWGLRRCS